MAKVDETDLVLRARKHGQRIEDTAKALEVLEHDTAQLLRARPAIAWSDRSMVLRVVERTEDLGATVQRPLAISGRFWEILEEVLEEATEQCIREVARRVDAEAAQYRAQLNAWVGPAPEKVVGSGT